MKSIVLLSCFILLISSVFAADNTLQKFPANHNVSLDKADYSIDLHNSDIILTCSHGKHGSIRITPKYDVYLDDSLIELNGEQKKVVGNYYELTMDLLDKAKDVGLEGAKIGVRGAALGVKAVGNVLKLVLPNYDTEDLERDMERESAKIEAKAADLESEAKELEKLADELKKAQDEMKESIPEIERVEWF
jgi:hypothetical protein